jgi:hypothetical protein
LIGTLRGGTPFTLGGGEDKPGLPQEEGEEISISTPLNMENPEPDGDDVFGALPDIMEIPSSPEERVDTPPTVATPPTEGGGDGDFFGALPDIMEIPSFTEEVGTRPTAGPLFDPEERGQPSSSELHQDPPQSSRQEEERGQPSSSELHQDPSGREGEGGEPSSKSKRRKMIADLTRDTLEGSAKLAAAHEEREARREVARRAQALEELNADLSPEMAKAQLCKDLEPALRRLLYDKMEIKSPLLVRGPEKVTEIAMKIVQDILTAQGKSIDSVEDLHTLKLDLADPKTRDAVLDPFVRTYKKSRYR